MRPARLILPVLIACLCSSCALREAPPSYGIPQITGLSADADVRSAVLQAVVSNLQTAASGPTADASGSQSSSEGGTEAGIVECGFELYPGAGPVGDGAPQPSAGEDARQVAARMSPGGTFTASVTGLLPDSDYAFRAFAGNGVSRVYSDYSGFRTGPLPQGNPQDEDDPRYIDLLEVRYVAAEGGMTPLLPDDASLAAVEGMYVDNVGAEPCRTYRFETAGEHSVRWAFRDGRMPRRFLCCEEGTPLPVTYVFVPDTFTSLPDSAFFGCSSIKCIRVPERCRTFGTDVFRGCTGLEKFDCPNALEGGRLLAIGTTGIYYAGAGYEGYEAKRLPKADCARMFTLSGAVANDCYPEQADGLQLSTRTRSIRMSYARGVKAVLLHGNNTEILPDRVQPSLRYISITNESAGGIPGAPVLCGCDSLDVAVFQSGVRHVRYLCCDCPLLRIVSLPQGLVEIGDSSFVNCPTLTSLKVPDNVESIGSWSFSGCTGLENVYIGKAVTRIGESVLKMPEGVESSLSKLFFASALPPDGFPADIPSGTVIYVPETSLDLYRSLRPDLASRIVGMDYTDFNFSNQ